MATPQFEHPKIDWDAADLYQDFDRFSRSHTTFVFDGPLSELTAKQQAGWLGTWIGEQGREVNKTLEWAEGEKEDLIKVLDKFASLHQTKEVDLTLQCRNCDTSAEFEIVNIAQENVLSGTTAEALGLIDLIPYKRLLKQKKTIQSEISFLQRLSQKV